MFGGAEKVASLVAQAQAAAGHEVFACSLTRTPQPEGQREGVNTCPVAGRNPLWIEDGNRYPAPVRLLNKAATVFNPVTARQFARLLDRVRPDVVHTHSLVAWPPSIWDKAARRAIPVVHTLHDYDLLCIRATLFKDGESCRSRHLTCRLLSARKRALHDHISLVTAVSQSVLDTHLAYGLFAHLPPGRRQIVWNPVELPTAASPRPPHEGPLRFGYLGRLVSEKGVGTMIDAARRLAPDGWTLTLAGEGPDQPRFEAQATGLPVRFVGRQDAMSFLAEIDVLLCVPLWDEPFGLTVLEGYAAGCRVIGTTRGFIGDTVSRIDPGWTVEPDDSASLATAMANAIDSGASRPANADVLSAILLDLQPNIVAQRYLLAYEQTISKTDQTS